MDGWLAVNFNINVNVAQEPLEDGTVVSDHVAARPTSFTVKGIVTNNRQSFAFSGLTEGGDSDLPNQLGPGRVDNAKREIDIVCSTGEVFPVDTPWGYYPHVVVKKASIRQTGSDAEISLNLQAIRIIGLKGSPSTLAPATTRLDYSDKGNTRINEDEEDVKKKHFLYPLTGKTITDLVVRAVDRQGNLIMDKNAHSGLAHLVTTRGQEGLTDMQKGIDDVRKNGPRKNDNGEISDPRLAALLKKNKELRKEVEAGNYNRVSIEYARLGLYDLATEANEDIRKREQILNTKVEIKNLVTLNQNSAS